MSILMAMAVAIISASAATTKTIYLKPNGWESDGAVLEAWIWGGGDQWVTFNDTDADGVFEATVPSGTTGFKLLRRSPSHKKGSWDSGTYWNQTGDINLGGKNCVKLTNWSGGYSTENFTPTPSDPVVAVAGSMNGWSTDANKVTSENGVATITISNIAEGEKTFKIVVNGSWVGYTGINIDSLSNISMSDKGGNDHNIMFNTEGAGSATFTYTIATKTIKVVWTCDDHIYANDCDTDCNDCGATREITHTYMDGVCDCGEKIDVLEKNGEGVIVLGEDFNAQGTIVFTENSVIDLNGKTLIANGVITFHESTRFVGEGKLVIPQNGLVLAGEADHMAVWVGDGYVFNEVVDQFKSAVTGDDSFNVVFRPSFGTTEHNKTILGGNTNAGLTFELQIWNGENKVFAGTLNADIVKQAYAENGAISIRVNSAPAGTYTVKLVIKSTTGLTNTANLGTITIPVVEEIPEGN